MSEDGEQPDDSQKTEDPSPKKLEEARKKGQVALSREVNNWAMLFAGTMLIAAFAAPMMRDLTGIMRFYIENAAQIPTGGAGDVVSKGILKIFLLLAMPMLFLCFIAFLSPFLQVGPLFAPEIIKMDIGKISPFKGFQRLFSMRSIMELVKGI